MAIRSQSTALTTDKKARKTRSSKPQYYTAKLAGAAGPMIVVAHTQKDALAAVVTMKAASAADLIEAGKNGYTFIDTTAPGTIGALQAQLLADKAAE